jgi:molybdopterin-guanine dinucleotide biosynthesis protein A
VSGIAIFILAGGKSSRMGADKAFLGLGGRTLLDRALALAASVAGGGAATPGGAVERRSTGSKPVFIVGDPAKFAAFAPAVQDIYPDRGPLGGIHAALRSSNADLNLMLAVDLPFVSAQLLNHLLLRAEKSGAVVTVPYVEGRYQPLSAVYRKEFAVVAEAALARGKNKIDPLFAEVQLCVVSREELADACVSTTAFRNVNTPEGWEQAKRELE